VPELPEVETLRRGLERSVLGQRIVAGHLVNAKVLKGQSEAEFRDRAIGRTLGRPIRRGKFLLIPLLAVPPLSSSTDPEPAALWLCIHLKMRGQLLLAAQETEVAPYHCASLVLESGQELRLHDMWGWGELRALTAVERDAISALSSMGEEPLEAGWGAETLAIRLGVRAIPIKTALLDQRVVAGVGNIYADEALWRARIAPTRSVRTLQAPQVQALADGVKSVLTEAVSEGGTRGEFVDLEGRTGRFEPAVYGREGQRCDRCNTLFVKIRLGGRGTVFCDTCQK
jgi:formamidopyrimidine-DNA glycosylase